MINVFDFCETCAETTTVKLSFFNADSDDYITSLILHDAKVGVKTLSATCRYAHVECFYTSTDVICAKVRVHACDM